MPSGHPDGVGIVLALGTMVCAGIVLLVDLRWGVWAKLPARAAHRPWSRILLRAFFGCMMVLGALQAWDHWVRVPPWSDTLDTVVVAGAGLCAVGALLLALWARAEGNLAR